MIENFELLAPGGDIDSIKAAIWAGADAIYCGLSKFNARNRATNISIDDLRGILRLAHNNNCKVFLTLNIIILDSEIPALFKLLNKLINTGIDGIIVQDIGLIYLIRKYFKELDIHASTQLTTHNQGQIKFLAQLNVSRVNLSRELNIKEIKKLTQLAHNRNLQTEVFVHGSYCLSFSGLCYFSSVQTGNSGNRGCCSQPCRDRYTTTPAGKDYPLNLKDNSAFLDIPALADAKVDSLKIEGRIKKYHYVYSVVKSWRKQLQLFYNQENTIQNKNELYKVFNRDFSNSFLSGNIDKEMFINNPRDHSAIQRAIQKGGLTEVYLELAKREIYDERTEIINLVKSKIESLSIAKVPLTIIAWGKIGTPLYIELISNEKTFIVKSESVLVKNSTEPLNDELLFKRLKAINESEFIIEKIKTKNLEQGLHIPFKELTELRNQILMNLNHSRIYKEPVTFPKTKSQTREKIIPSLSVIISSVKDLKLIEDSKATFYYKLPNSINDNLSEFVELFTKHKNITPWFPAILINKDFEAAIKFIQQIKPKLLVTNNTGIAHQACLKGIKWIAGPYLNTANSFSLLSLKEDFNCAGAFISNELKKVQIIKINKPENFDLYYSIYHPIELMTSRQCLFHQVTGCNKIKLDENCINQCEKSSSISNLRNENFIIEKSKGNYHRIFSETNYLNIDIVKDIPHLFSSFFIDLSNVNSTTKPGIDKLAFIKHFELLMNEPNNQPHILRQLIQPTTNKQYTTGI